VLSLRIACFLDDVSTPAVSYPSRGRLTVRGSTSQVVEAIGQYQEAGVEHVVLEMSTQTHASILQTMETFIERIKPQVG
jgi:hypothetical protein